MAEYTPGQMADLLTKAGQEGRKALVNAVRRGMTRTRNYAVDGFKSRGIGRAIFGANKKGAKVIIKRQRVRIEGDTVVGGLDIKGLAALQETGGRTGPHSIPRAFGRAGSAKHPGGPVAAFPFVGDAVSRAEPEIRGQISDAYSQAFETAMEFPVAFR